MNIILNLQMLESNGQQAEFNWSTASNYCNKHVQRTLD